MKNPLEILYPPRCIGCFEVVESGQMFCESCRKAFEKSLAVDDRRIGEFYCLSLYRYTAVVRQSVWNIKYKHSLTVCRKAGMLLADAARQSVAYFSADLVVDVPMTKTEKKRRGFNQSEILAQLVAKNLNLPFSPKGLVKVKETAPQKVLSAAKRLRNMRGAFRADEKVVGGKRVLLIDDVVTTGATVRSAAEALMKAGAVDVFVLSFASA